MAKDLDFAVGQGEAHGGLVAHVGLDASSKSTPAVSKLLKVWENRQAQQAARVGGLGLMAVSLAACGGSSTTDDTDDTDDDDDVAVGAQEGLSFKTSLRIFVRIGLTSWRCSCPFMAVVLVLVVVVVESVDHQLSSNTDCR